MDADLQIVEVELVESDLIGIRLSDETAILVSASELLSLGLPRFMLLPDDNTETTLQ